MSTSTTPTPAKAATASHQRNTRRPQTHTQPQSSLNTSQQQQQQQPHASQQQQPQQQQQHAPGKRWHSARSSIASNGSRDDQGGSPAGSPLQSTPGSSNTLQNSSTQGTQPSSSPASKMPAAVQEQHARLLFVLANMVGVATQITAADGAIYDGVFSSAAPARDTNVKLRTARRRRWLNDQVGSQVRNLLIDARDISSISALNIDTQTVSVRLNTNKNAFQTDTAISNVAATGERTLQKWGDSSLSDGADSGLGMSAAASDKPDRPAGAWDQFAVNEKLFGVTSDFKEELYTTKLDTSRADYQQRLRAAEKLAREIEQGPTDNVHLAEERNLIPLTNRDDMDEEEKYSSVIRAPGKYVPPGPSRGTSPQRDQSPATTSSRAPGLTETTSTKPRESQETGTETSTSNTDATTMSQQSDKKLDSRSGSKEGGKTSQGTSSTLEQIVKRRTQQQPQPEGFKPVDLQNVSKDFKEYSQGQKNMLMEKRHGILSPDKAEKIVEFKNFSQQLSQKLPPLKDEGSPTMALPNMHGTSRTTDKYVQNATQGDVGNTSGELHGSDVGDHHLVDGGAPDMAMSISQDATDSDVSRSFKFNVEAEEFVPGGSGSGGGNGGGEGDGGYGSGMHHQQPKRKISGNMGMGGYQTGGNGKYNNGNNKYNKGMGNKGHHMGGNMGMMTQFPYGAAPYYGYPGDEGFAMPQYYNPMLYSGMPFPPQGANAMPMYPMMMPYGVPVTGAPPVGPPGPHGGVSVPVGSMIPAMVGTAVSVPPTGAEVEPKDRSVPPSSSSPEGVPTAPDNALPDKTA